MLTATHRVFVKVVAYCWDDKKINKQKPRFTTTAVDSTGTHRKRQKKQEAGRMIERAVCMVCTEDELIKWRVEEVDNENDTSIQFGRGMDYGSNKGRSVIRARWMSHLYQNFLSRLVDIWKDFIMAKITEASQSAGLFRQPIGARGAYMLYPHPLPYKSSTLHYVTFRASRLNTKRDPCLRDHTTSSLPFLTFFPSLPAPHGRGLRGIGDTVTWFTFFCIKPKVEFASFID